MVGKGDACGRDPAHAVAAEIRLVDVANAAKNWDGRYAQLDPGLVCGQIDFIAFILNRKNVDSWRKARHRFSQKRETAMAARKKTRKPAKAKKKPAARKKAKAPARKAASAAAKRAKRAVPAPKAKPNRDLKKFSAAIRKDAALRKQLQEPMTNAEFHKKTVALGAARGLHFTVAESKWHVAETQRLASSSTLFRPSPWDQANPGHG
jgi:hypothetical protein